MGDPEAERSRVIASESSAGGRVPWVSTATCSTEGAAWLDSSSETIPTAITSTAAIEMPMATPRRSDRAGSGMTTTP